MPPQFVRHYVKSQKNGAADAEAICEAVQRPTIRFVPVKGADQQAVLLLHRARDLLIRQRSSLISAIRAHFAEFGVVVGRRMRNIDQLLELLVAEETALPGLARRMLAVLADQLRDVAARVAVVEGELMAWHRANEVSRRLATIPGVGPITASAIVATVGCATQFKSGRQFAAWLGLVPQQRSSGDKERLGRISKRGDRYIRRLMIHGVRAVVGWPKRWPMAGDPWLGGLLARRHVNVATVAFANKSARTAWALMARGRSYTTVRARAA
jgi:transposase